MKIVVEIPDDKTYIDIPTDNLNIFIRLYPICLKNGHYNFNCFDGLSNDEIQSMFDVNKKLKGVLFVKTI